MNMHVDKDGVQHYRLTFREIVAGDPDTELHRACFMALKDDEMRQVGASFRQVARIYPFFRLGTQAPPIFGWSSPSVDMDPFVEGVLGDDYKPEVNAPFKQSAGKSGTFGRVKVLDKKAGWQYPLRSRMRDWLAKRRLEIEKQGVYGGGLQFHAYMAFHRGDVGTVMVMHADKRLAQTKHYRDFLVDAKKFKYALKRRI